MLVRYPYGFNMVQSGSVMGGTDAMVQKVQKKDDRYDLWRGAVMVGWAALLSTPFHLTLWRYCDKMWPKKSFTGAAVKGFGTAIVFGLPTNCAFLTFTTCAGAYLQGKSVDKSLLAHRLRHDAPNMWANGIAYWGVSNTANFAFVPAQYRIPFMALCSTFWMAYLSVLSTSNSSQQKSSSA